jgi:hypothetical protein
MPGTVTVACKIENGIVLQIYEWEMRSIQVMGGGVKEVKIAKPLPWLHRINGPARRIGQDVGYQISDGAALTHGVDADKFAIWMEQNKDIDMVKNGLVFANTKVNDVVAQAHEHRSQKGDFASIDPKNLPAEFRGKIETAVAA